MSDSTERLISSLAEELEPVRPLPRLRSAFAIVLAVWATFLAVMLMSDGGAAGAMSGLRDSIYLASFLGLIVAALGGTVSALAAGIPGRERLEVAGLGLSLAGLVAAAIACLVGLRASGLDAPVAPPGLHGMCFRNAALSSLLPAGVILSFLVRGWSAHPVRAAIVAWVASGALGTLVVHLSCGFIGPRHVLMGHLSVPLVLAGLGLYPLALLLRRLRG